MKFLIKRIEVPIEYIGASTKWGSGETPFVNYSTSMQGRKVGNNIRSKSTRLNSSHRNTSRMPSSA